MAAGEIFLERDDVAFLRAPARPRDVAELLDYTDHLMAENARAGFGREIHAPIADVDASRFDPHQTGIGRDFGHNEFPNLRMIWLGQHRGLDACYHRFRESYLTEQ